MIKYSKLVCAAAVLMCTALMGGCGGGSSTSTSASSTTSSISGVATMTPIKNGLIFADRLVGGASNFILDAGEVSTTTDANGNFSLAAPAYDYVLVSRGGMDQDNNPQILMLAPKNSRNITPLTTLVALDTTNTLAARLQALQGGVSFDTNIYTNSSPAMLTLVKSVEMAVQSLTKSLQNQAPGGVLTADRVYSLQVRMLQDIAKTFTSSGRDLSIPNNVYLDLSTALNLALQHIQTDTGNYFTLTSPAATIAAQAALAAVDTAASFYNANWDVFPYPALSKVCGTVTAESAWMISYATPYNNAQAASVTALGGLFAPSLGAPAFGNITVPVITFPAETIVTGASGGSGGGLGGGLQ